MAVMIGRHPDLEAEAFILSLHPALYLPLWKREGNRFPSADASGTLFTATGTSLTSRGRAFNGTSEYLKVSVPDWRIGDTKGTLGFWVLITASGATQMVFGSGDEALATKYIRCGVGTSDSLIISRRDGGGITTMQGSYTGYTDKSFHFGVVSSDGSQYFLYTDGKAGSFTATSGVNDGGWFNAVSARDNIAVGALITNTTQNYVSGIIGSIIYFPLCLKPAEILTLYEKTKWRYR